MAFTSAFGIGSAAPTRGWAACRIALATAAATTALLALPGAAPPHTGSVEIHVTNLRSQKGVIQLCLTRDPKDFPDCRNGQSAIKRTLPATNPNVRLEGLPPGDYAIAVIHDANSNAKLDTTLGIPREGFGFSRNPAIRFGPPRFTSASFAVSGDAGIQQIRIRYML